MRGGGGGGSCDGSACACVCMGGGGLQGHLNGTLLIALSAYANQQLSVSG